MVEIVNYIIFEFYLEIILFVKILNYLFGVIVILEFSYIF